jgi:[ribosomal protein S5]-alanine N-acetyltransferase
MSMADSAFITELLSDEQVMRYWPRPYTSEEAIEWIERQQERYASHGFGYWLMLDKTTNQPIGQSGLLAQEIEGVEEIGLGYIISSRHWRQGYAKEAAAAMISYAFNQLGKQRVIALIRPENIPSRGVATSVGLRDEGKILYKGFDHLIYSIRR